MQLVCCVWGELVFVSGWRNDKLVKKQSKLLKATGTSFIDQEQKSYLACFLSGTELYKLVEWSAGAV